jgi:hypothetical protein
MKRDRNAKDAKKGPTSQLKVVSNDRIVYPSDVSGCKANCCVMI